MRGRGGTTGAVFYAEKYHPIQAGSIDGTDVAPHDNAVLRAFLCSSAGLYDPFVDPKAAGDPYSTVFVGHLSRLTDEETLRKAMSRYGRVKSMRLVRDIGGGLGGKKESGQLRFGGRERPFRAPLRPIPYDELKKLGIPPPPEGRYMTRFQVPPPLRQNGGNVDREESPPPRRRSKDRGDGSYRKQRSPTQDEGSPHRRKSSHDNQEESQQRRRSSTNRESSTYSRQRSPTEDDGDHRKQRRSRVPGDVSSYSRQRNPTEDDGEHRKRRRSREPGEISPGRESGSRKSGRTSTETGYSPRRSHQQRHHGEHPHDSSGRSRDSSRRHNGDRTHSRRSESRDCSH